MNGERHRLIVGRLAVLAAACVLAALLRLAGSGFDSSSRITGDTVIETVRRDGASSFILLEGPATVCGVLDQAGIRTRCRSDRQLKSGDAIFEVGLDSWRVGIMDGRSLILFGLPIPVNRAGADDLVAIDGIGPARAAAIVTDRNVRGPFLCPGDLSRIKGIGQATAARISAWMSFEVD
ncbi:MAG TPA: helix-hairpin-helix domain-containing protein [Myxococcota bacterium]|nr:helix-hairpin-helix domain-containing protein [Myxococcota bacterium]HOD00325.1 helix-hairpin-helix domain-containing protein [Myxococcota bacterium]HOH75954.1 helix-hairpin-helix domain-containing protein [Myxococcota bacterium]HPV03148.1 helix-hairpin-helix domain-containing protein [Myxococcota bacterium]